MNYYFLYIAHIYLLENYFENVNYYHDYNCFDKMVMIISSCYKNFDLLFLENIL